MALEQLRNPRSRLWDYEFRDCYKRPSDYDGGGLRMTWDGVIGVEWAPGIDLFWWL